MHTNKKVGTAPTRVVKLLLKKAYGDYCRVIGKKRLKFRKWLAWYKFLGANDVEA